jgi:hypothetical protein
MKKWTYELNREVSKKHVQMANKYMKKCSSSLVIKVMQNQNYTKISFHPS